MSRKIDLTGRRFSRLVVISKAYSDGKHLYWNCKCDCGKEIIVCGDLLKRNLTKSCGCFNSETVRTRNHKHGDSRTRLYHIWQQMIYRCKNPNATGFEHWGGKGISVCSKWRNNYENFRDWAMVNGYSDDLEIDRINPNGNYESLNCQWITKLENIKKMWADKRVM
jgi:hypothetical protein